MVKKIIISYTDEADVAVILDALNPLITGAKIRKNDTPKPYKHLYIELQNPRNCGHIKEKA